MNTSVIIAAIVCITIMVIIAIVMGKKINTANKLFSDLNYAMQGYIAAIVNAVDNTKHAVKQTGEALDSRLKENYFHSVDRMGECTECLVKEIDEVIGNLQAIERQAKEGIKVSVGLQAIKPAPAPTPKANTDPKKIAKAAEKENEARKIYAKAAKLRKAGKSFRAIADELGYKSGRSIQRIIERGTEKNW